MTTGSVLNFLEEQSSYNQLSISLITK